MSWPWAGGGLDTFSPLSPVHHLACLAGLRPLAGAIANADHSCTGGVKVERATAILRGGPKLTMAEPTSGGSDDDNKEGGPAPYLATWLVKHKVTVPVFKTGMEFGVSGKKVRS